MTEADAPKAPRWRALLGRCAPRVSNWREIGSNVGELGAIGAVSHGFWLITPAAGWISAGIGVGVVSVAVGVGGSG